MVPKIFELERFGRELGASLQRETFNCPSIKVARHSNIYNCGDKDGAIYFVESGRVKLLTFSPEGKESILGIRADGDIFGESCLADSRMRLETATAMQDTELKRVSCSHFIGLLGRDSLFEGFARYLVARLTDQQQIIADLLMVDSEHRLAVTLLKLARALGRKESTKIRLDLKISQEELSEMVGTTRPRISFFLQRFRNLGLIETDLRSRFIVDENRLVDYLAQSGKRDTLKSQQRQPTYFRKRPRFDGINPTA